MASYAPDVETKAADIIGLYLDPPTGYINNTCTTGCSVL